MRHDSLYRETPNGVAPIEETTATECATSEAGPRSEVDNARIFGGMHYRHSVKEGNRLGRMVAEYVVKNHFRPKDND